MALSVTMALIGSLIFSVTLVPLLAYWMLRRKLPHQDNWLVAGAKRLYLPVLAWALENKRKIVAIALGAFVLSIVAASRLGSEFLPELDEGTFWINFDLPSSISTSEAARVLHTVRKALLGIPEVRTTVSKAGQPEDGTDPKTTSMAEVYVDVKPKEEWRAGLTRERLIDDMDHAISAIPGIDPDKQFARRFQDHPAQLLPVLFATHAGVHV